MLELWRGATYREERYAALAVAGHRPYRGFLLGEPAESLRMLDELVVTGAWWDLVDETATRLVGPLLLSPPRTWSAPVRAARGRPTRTGGAGAPR